MAQAAPWRDPWEATIPPPPPEDRDEPAPRRRREGEHLIPPVDWGGLLEWLKGRDIPPPDVSGLPGWMWRMPGGPGPERAWRGRPGAQPPPETAWPTRPPSPAGGFEPAYPQWAEGFEGMSPRLQAWMEQVQAWERGEIPALPTPPEGLVLPREWKEWYGQVTTPELHPEGNVQYYQRQYEGAPEVSLPEDFTRKTDEEQMSWLSAHAYETVYTDESGNIIDVSEVLRRAVVNPDDPVTLVWMMGGGVTKEFEFSAADIETVESLMPPKPREAGAEVIGGEWMRPGTSAAEKARAQEVLGSSLVQSVLQSEWSYDEKKETIQDLYSQLTGKALGLPARQAIDTAIYQSLTPEQQAAHGKGKPEDIREPVVEGEEPLDVAAMTKALAQFGVNLTDNYPFISPITRETLMRIPSETLEMMSRYLEGKGVSWQDFISVSAGLYGGGAPARGRWEIPRQWG